MLRAEPDPRAEDCADRKPKVGWVYVDKITDRAVCSSPETAQTLLGQCTPQETHITSE